MLDSSKLEDQHTNVNCWEHWLLLTGEGYGIKALEMPKENVQIMVRGWIAAFEGTFRKIDFLRNSRILLHYETRRYVLELLDEYELKFKKIIPNYFNEN